VYGEEKNEVGPAVDPAGTPQVLPAGGGGGGTLSLTRKASHQNSGYIMPMHSLNGIIKNNK
jgi:hypothetical protein